MLLVLSLHSPAKDKMRMDGCLKNTDFLKVLFDLNTAFLNARQTLPSALSCNAVMRRLFSVRSVGMLAKQTNTLSDCGMVAWGWRLWAHSKLIKDEPSAAPYHSRTNCWAARLPLGTVTSQVVAFCLVSISAINFNVWIINAEGSDLSVDSGFSFNSYSAFVWRSSIYRRVRVGVRLRVHICVQKKKKKTSIVRFCLLPCKNPSPSSIRWQTASLSRPELNQW